MANLSKLLPYFFSKKAVVLFQTTTARDYRKLAPDLNQHFLLFKFATIFQDKMNDYLICVKLTVKSCIILSIYLKILRRYEKTFDN